MSDSLPIPKDFKNKRNRYASEKSFATAFKKRYLSSNDCHHFRIETRTVRGVPDINVQFLGFPTFWIEFKHETLKLRPEQVSFIHLRAWLDDNIFIVSWFKNEIHCVYNPLFFSESGSPYFKNNKIFKMTMREERDTFEKYVKSILIKKEYSYGKY